MGFNGFVVGDWNGHGQVPGCTNTDCPQSLNAGLDMYMAPDSWKGLYESTLKHVKSGTIPMSRLDDAVRRILRVKIASGIFTKGAPSTRTNAGNEKLLGTPQNREIARQAVRESMVLLKNNNATLPIDPSKNILIIGDGAKSISKASGGWTLSWQGKGHSNDEFPNAQSIFDGFKEAIEDAGGNIMFSENGISKVKPDVVIAVYGEDPYAEFQGDKADLDFIPNGFDTEQLESFKNQNIPVVSVFLSGRPMWTNPEINDSDAFIAAWLPGSEGGGISDLIFQRDPSFDFTGKLPFAWPSSAKVDGKSDPVFPLGFGLTYNNKKLTQKLSEDSGLGKVEVASNGQFYEKGIAVEPWGLWGYSDDLNKQIASYPTSFGALIVSKTDHLAQEDALRLKWINTANDQFRISTASTDDMSRQSNGAMELAFSAKSFNKTAAMVKLAICDEASNCDKALDIKIEGDWSEYRISLSCFADMGVDMTKIKTALMLKGANNTDIGIGNIRLASDDDAKPGCDGK